MEFRIGPYYERENRPLPKFTGEAIGHFEIDPETKDIKIAVSKDTDLGQQKSQSLLTDFF